MSATPAQKARLRGAILELVQEQQEKQQHRHDDFTLLETMRLLNFGIHLNLLRTLLQDLIECEYLAAEQRQDQRTGETSITKIMIRPAGRRLLEGKMKDAGVMVL